MTSIARRINTSFWLKRFGDIMGFNLILILLIVGTFMYWRYEELPAGEHVSRFYWTSDAGYEDFTFVYETEEGNTYPYPVRNVADYLIYPGLILLFFECVHLLFAVFGTSSIRQKLKPLNELAITADKISAIPLVPSKIDSF